MRIEKGRLRRNGNCDIRQDLQDKQDMGGLRRNSKSESTADYTDDGDGGLRPNTNCNCE